MAVHVEDGAGGLVAEACGDDLRVLAGLDEQGDVAVPEVAESAWFPYGCSHGRQPVAAPGVGASEGAAFGCPCEAEHAHLAAAAASYRDPGVQFVGIVYQDTTEAASAFLDRLGWTPGTIYLLDQGSRAIIEFVVVAVPETFFVDPNGIIVDKVYGPVDYTLLDGKLDSLPSGIGR